MNSPGSNDSPAPGTVLAGRYRVERVLAAGGEGVVILALHLGLMARVALKLAHRDRLADPGSVRRALREARAAFGLRSEHVARVLDADTLDDGLPFLVMEFLEGTDLRRLIARRGALPLAEAIGYVLHACEAVAEAHAAGIVHRDLKPSNLFLTQRADGTPLIKVLDFGLAKLLRIAPNSDTWTEVTRPGDTMGSPRYMSPEQIRNTRGVDQRTDIWSIGAVLYELLAGVPAFGAPSPHESIAAVLTRHPPPLGDHGVVVPSRVEDVILRCLRKDPAERPPTIAEVTRELAPWAPSWACSNAERALRMVGRVTVPDDGRLDPLAGAPSTVPRARGRRRAVLVLAAAASASAVVLAGGLMRRPPPSVPGIAIGGAQAADGIGAPAREAVSAAMPPAPEANRVAAVTPPEATSVAAVPTAVSPPPATTASPPAPNALPPPTQPRARSAALGWTRPKAPPAEGPPLDDDPLAGRQ